MKSNTTKLINVGDAVKIKDKIYLVFEIRENHLFCRHYLFTKTGRFQSYQDCSFPIDECQLANEKEKQNINEDRIRATLQRRPYSPIADNYVRHLIR